jgi:hypothetical protein
MHSAARLEPSLSPLASRLPIALSSRGVASFLRRLQSLGLIKEIAIAFRRELSQRPSRDACTLTGGLGKSQLPLALSTRSVPLATLAFSRAGQRNRDRKSPGALAASLSQRLLSLGPIKEILTVYPV